MPIILASSARAYCVTTAAASFAGRRRLLLRVKWYDAPRDLPVGRMVLMFLSGVNQRVNGGTFSRRYDGIVEMRPKRRRRRPNHI